MALLMRAGVLLSMYMLATAANAQRTSSDMTAMPDLTFTLRTEIANGKLAYISDSGPTKGEVNPDLKIPEKAVVQINLINGDGAVHDIAIPEFKVKSDEIRTKGSAPFPGRSYASAKATL